MRLFRSVKLIINRQTFIITGLAVIATYLARAHGITADFPLTLLGIAIVFPVVFSIGEAYKRREKALDQSGSLMAHGRAIYFASRDWIRDNSNEAEKDLIKILQSIFKDATTYYHSATEKEEVKNEELVYKDFSQLSLFIESMKDRGMSGSEGTRVNQFLSKMMVAFESMKHIYQYRTPRTLRIYSKLFIYILPVIYAPYFAHISMEYTVGLEYIMPILFSIIFVSLDNIQDHLENPYDLHGEDDITMNAEKYGSTLK